MGQPTHCYDAKKIGDFSLEIIEEDKKFNTLLEKEIFLKRKESCIFTGWKSN